MHEIVDCLLYYAGETYMSSCFWLHSRSSLCCTRVHLRRNKTSNRTVVSSAGTRSTLDEWPCSDTREL